MVTIQLGTKDNKTIVHISKVDTWFCGVVKIGSSQHKLAKWLAEILVPVLKLYSSNCVKDSFTFANIIQNCNLKPAKSFLCYFDISSLFTNVPFDETIEICADALYRGQLDCPLFPEDTFREFLLIVIRGVENLYVLHFIMLISSLTQSHSHMYAQQVSVKLS